MLHLLMTAIIFATSLSVTARELPGDSYAGLQLGSAFDSRRHSDLSAACVAGSKVDVGLAEGAIRFGNDADFNTIANAFSVSASLDVDVPFVKANATVEFAREHASDDKRMNWFVEFSATRKSEVFDVNNLAVSTYGKNEFARLGNEIHQSCGDEFVYKVDYGASFIGTMSIDFATSSDREEFGLAAAVDVDFVVGSAKATTEINKLTKRMGSSTRVKVEARQFGGDPGQLGAIFGEAEVIYCDLSNLDKCLNSFANLIKYAGKEFKEQLRDASGYNAIRFHTRRYEDSSARSLVPREGFPIVNSLVVARRETLQGDYEQEAMAYSRTLFIRSRLRHFLTEQQLRDVETVHKKSWNNMKMLSEAMTTCLNFPDQRCIDFTIERASYDRALLEVKITDVLDPNSYIGKLFNAVDSGDVRKAYNDAIRPGGNQLITECGPSGLSPCHRAIEKGQTEMLSLFIREDPFEGSATKSAINHADDTYNKFTPMCYAALGDTKKHVECINLLTTAGAAFDSVTESGFTPLQIAVKNGNVTTTRKLIKIGANIQVKDWQGFGLLHFAAQADNSDVIEVLIDHGLSVADVDKDQRTPLHIAAASGNLKAVSTLLRRGADSRSVDIHGRAPLHDAMKYESVATELLEIHKIKYVPVEVEEKVVRAHGIAVSPDGGLVSHPFHAISWVCNAKTGKREILCPAQRSGRIVSPAFSHDGTMFAYAALWGVRLFSMTEKKSMDSVFPEDTNAVDVVFAKDNHGIIVLGAANSLAKYDLETKTASWQAATSAAATSIAISHDGKLVAALNEGGAVEIFDAHSGKLQRTIQASSSTVKSAAFDYEGQLVTTFGSGVKIWNPQSGEKIREFTPHSCDIFSVGTSSVDPLLFSASNDKTIAISHSKSGRLLGVIKGTNASGKDMAVSLDGQTVATSGDNEITKVWHLQSDNILTAAVKAGSLPMVRLIAEKFPLLLFMRNSAQERPLDVAEELITNFASAGLSAMPEIKSFLLQAMNLD